MHHATTIEVAQFLKNQGLDINGETTDLNSPLIIAASCGLKDLVDWLLKNDVSIQKTNREGTDALIACVYWKSSVEKIIKRRKEIFYYFLSDGSL